jgi:cell volume regulation protein A
MSAIEPYVIGIALLLILSVLANKATGRLGVPALLVFLLMGMLTGSEGIGGIDFDNPFYASGLGIVSLSLILFSGGLDTRWSEIRPIVKPGIALVTLGIFITCVLTGWFAMLVLGLNWKEGALLGAIVSSTDATAVFTVLRAKNVHLKAGLKPILELESGSNDPIAVLLTLGLIQLITQPSISSASLIPNFFQQVIIGGAVGYFAGKGIASLLNQVKLEFEGLYPVLSVALVLMTFGSTQWLGGSGFLAIYLTGLTLGTKNFIHKKSLTLFHDGISWLSTILMFLTLGLLVFPSRLVAVIPQGLLLSAFLILVARPIAVFISLYGSQFGIREKALISWVGLRGSAPIILATFPLLAGIEKADLIFNVVFFIVLTSVLIQGTSIPLVARALRVDAPARPKFRYPIEYVPSGNMKSDLVEVEVPIASPAIGKSILELHLPKEVLVVLIQRNGNIIVPKGSTRIESEDSMLVLADPENLVATRKILIPS